MPPTLKRYAESNEIRLDFVQKPAGAKIVYIAGGYMEHERAWAPSDDLVRGKSDTMLLKLNRQSKMLRELCGTSLRVLKWLDVLHELRNIKCAEAADLAESSIDPTQRTKTSKRSRAAMQELPELVVLQMPTVDR